VTGKTDVTADGSVGARDPCRGAYAGRVVVTFSAAAKKALAHVRHFSTRFATRRIVPGGRKDADTGREEIEIYDERDARAGDDNYTEEDKKKKKRKSTMIKITTDTRRDYRTK
jgi:hypothetical protein